MIHTYTTENTPFLKTLSEWKNAGLLSMPQTLIDIWSSHYGIKSYVEATMLLNLLIPMDYPSFYVNGIVEYNSDAAYSAKTPLLIHYAVANPEIGGKLGLNVLVHTDNIPSANEVVAFIDKLHSLIYKDPVKALNSAHELRRGTLPVDDYSYLLNGLETQPSACSRIIDYIIYELDIEWYILKKR